MKVLEKFKQKLRYKRYASSTIQAYTASVYNFLKDTEVRDPYSVTTKEIMKYLEDRSYTSISQQNQYIGGIKLFAKYILGKKMVHLRKIERPRRDKTLPEVVEKQAMLDMIDQISYTKHRAMVSLLYSTGIRAAELLNLKIEDIDSDRMLIRINLGKGNKDRYVPLSDHILGLLRSYFKECRPSVYLFNGKDGEPYSYSSLRKVCIKYTGVSPHKIRHSLATALVENGTNLAVIQKILGHAHVKTTEIYTHVSKVTLSQVDTPI